MKNFYRKIFFIIFLFLILLGIIFLLANKIHKWLATFSSQKPKVSVNPEVINEIIRIEQLSAADENGNSNITLQDLAKLKELLKEDKTGESYVNELERLVRNGESQHVLHITLYLREYLKTGVDIPCIPHELWHVSLFVRHGDMVYARLQLKNIEQDYGAWIKSNEQKRKDYPKKTYPKYYNILDDLERMSKESIEKLKQNDYSNETLHELETIGAASLC